MTGKHFQVLSRIPYPKNRKRIRRIIWKKQEKEKENTPPRKAVYFLFFRRLDFGIFHSIYRDSEYRYDYRGTYETKRTKRTDIESFLIDVISIETYSSSCHSGKNRKGFPADSEISEKSYKEDNRVYEHSESWKWKSEELRPRRDKYIGTGECAINVTKSGIRSGRFRYFRFECICLICEIYGISKSYCRKHHNGDKKFFHKQENE